MKSSVQSCAKRVPQLDRGGCLALRAKPPGRRPPPEFQNSPEATEGSPHLRGRPGFRSPGLGAGDGLGRQQGGAEGRREQPEAARAWVAGPGCKASLAQTKAGGRAAGSPWAGATPSHRVPSDPSQSPRRGLPLRPRSFGTLVYLICRTCHGAATFNGLNLRWSHKSVPEQADRTWRRD